MTEGRAGFREWPLMLVEEGPWRQIFPSEIMGLFKTGKGWRGVRRNIMRGGRIDKGTGIELQKGGEDWEMEMGRRRGKENGMIQRKESKKKAENAPNQIPLHLFFWIGCLFFSEEQLLKQICSAR